MRWLAATESPVILVSNEVGGGIVPACAVARRFQSEQGWLNQDVATLCEEVTLLLAGLPVPIKQGPHPLTRGKWAGCGTWPSRDSPLPGFCFSSSRATLKACTRVPSAVRFSALRREKPGCMPKSRTASLTPSGWSEGQGSQREWHVERSHAC